MRKILILGVLVLVGIVQMSVSAEIAIQSNLDSPEYSRFREKAAKALTAGEEECAKFVNRLFLARFGKMMFGDAWTMQIKPENLEYLMMEWKLPETEFFRNRALALSHYTDRVRHFEDLYDVLQQQEYPIGVLGWIYHYSNWRQFLASRRDLLPQSHVSFLAGKKIFFIENTTDKETTLQDILEKKYGNIHDFEKPFVEKLLGIKIRAKIRPGEKFMYEDFLIEENFKYVRAESFLAVFLRKHTGNGITPLLRPVSFSRISDSIIQEIEAQNIEQKRVGEEI